MDRNIKLIEERFGRDYVKSGDELMYNCPFCIKKRHKEDKDRKLYVNCKTLLFHCFKCQTKGRIRPKLLDVTGAFYEELQDLYKKRILNDNDSYEDDSNDNMFFVKNLPIMKGTAAYEYLQGRGITDEHIKFYNLRLGSDELFGRVVIPNEMFGQTWTDMYQARSFIGREPKYRNPDGCKKTESVFNLHNISEGGDVIVVEGAVTAICGGKDCIGMYGCHPSHSQLKALLQKSPRSITCSLDGDSAGQLGQEQLIRDLITMCYKGDLYTVQMPEGIDAADLGELEYKRYLKSHKKKYFSKFYIELEKLVLKNGTST